MQLLLSDSIKDEIDKAIGIKYLHALLSNALLSNKITNQTKYIELDLNNNGIDFIITDNNDNLELVATYSYKFSQIHIYNKSKHDLYVILMEQC